MDKNNESQQKKLNIIYTLRILEEYTDEQHKLSQSEIIDILKEKYGIECERKAIGRNIAALRESGYDIETGRGGTYMASRSFEASELRLLIDSVLCNRYISNRHSRDLILKLSSLGGRYFEHYTNNIQTLGNWSKSRNQSFLLAIEQMDEAITKGCQVRFNYNRYGTDKQLHPTSRRKSLVNPYYLLMHNQRYYLVGNVDKYDNLAFYRIDKMTEIEIMSTPIKPITVLPEYKDGLDIASLSTSLPYMFSDSPIEMKIKCPEFMIDDVIDWFGADVEVSDHGEYFVFKVCASPTAMQYWLMQYATNAEVIEPYYMRSVMVERGLEMIRRYTGKHIKL